MPKSSNLQASMLQYISNQRFLKSDSKILAAVSGGIDSMVMLILLHHAGINVVVAHCNFGLRGDESNLDEAFVRSEADKLGIPCRIEHFETTSYAVQNGLSIQMAARELRYRWFHELSVQEGFDAIAIAHNRDDRIETLFINLARGTSIRGLTGIRPMNGEIIRPLLFASRKEIEDYAKTHGVNFREDSSNATDKYARNYIRHHVIPGLEPYFPGIQQNLDRSIDHFSAVELFYNEAIERYKNEIVTVKDDLMYIDLQSLNKSPSPPTLLHEILKPFGFSNSIAAEILQGCYLSTNYTNLHESLHPDNHLNKISLFRVNSWTPKTPSTGKQYSSVTHRVIHDRKSLILQKLENEPQKEYLIDEHTLYISIPIRLEIDKFDKYSGFMPDTNPNIACLDGEKLQYPLLLRKWKHGDKFCPLGMKKMKKLSNFFIDAKLSLIEKERSWLLVSEGRIAWIVGWRIDDRFKITDETSIVVKFKYHT